MKTGKRASATNIGFRWRTETATNVVDMVQALADQLSWEAHHTIGLSESDAAHLRDRVITWWLTGEQGDRPPGRNVLFERACDGNDQQ